MPYMSSGKVLHALRYGWSYISYHYGQIFNPEPIFLRRTCATIGQHANLGFVSLTNPMTKLTIRQTGTMALSLIPGTTLS